jgi:hypothetical protein
MPRDAEVIELQKKLSDGAASRAVTNCCMARLDPMIRAYVNVLEADQMETRPRHQGSQALHELQRLHDDMGGAVFVRTLQLQHDLPGAITFKPFVGDGRPAIFGPPCTYSIDLTYSLYGQAGFSFHGNRRGCYLVASRFDIERKSAGLQTSPGINSAGTSKERPR